MKRWTDQPERCDAGEELLYTSLSNGEAIQLVKCSDSTLPYSLTVGNLFGSQTRFFGTTDAALRYLNAALQRRDKREERISDE